MLPLLLAACPNGTSDLHRYRQALDDGRCDAVEDVVLRDDCWTHRTEVDKRSWCAQVTNPAAAGECWFVLAEATMDPSLCPQAVPYADDCALHVLSAGFRALGEPGTRPGEHEAEVSARIQRAGLAVGDPRPWSAWYRQVLAGVVPFDRGACDAVPDPERRDACRHTGLALYQDRLNHARDRHLYPCDGGPLPSLLVRTPDPELDALVAARSDLCPAR